jgi:hypothetical protein
MPTRLVHPVRNWRRMSSEERLQIRNLVIVIVPSILLAIITLGIFTASLTQPLRVEAPFTFSATTYRPVDPEVCPGETLEWPVAFTIRRAPVMVISVRSLWDVQKNQTVTLPPGAAVGSLTFTNYTETTSVSRTAQLVVPLIEPGQYQVRAAVQEFNSQAAAYDVPFRVPDGCPPVEEKLGNG